MIKLSNISKIYRKDSSPVIALDNVSISIEKGEMVAIMGKSGCGKSTLINIMGGLSEMSKGEYYFEGEKVDFSHKNKLSKLRYENIGFIVQNFALINSKTAYDNIALPLSNMKSDKKRKIVEHYADKVGIRRKLSHFPYELSGGECQRVAIARALINKPKLILADEPTGSLDSANEKIVMDILKKISNNGTTVVIVTHDNSVSASCGRIIRMKDGRII